MARRRSEKAPAKRAPWKPASIALLAVAGFLVVTLDDRHAGRVSDECQLVYTAVALAERGSLSLAPDARLFNAVPLAPHANPASTADGAKDGKANDGGQGADGLVVSRYGIGASLVQLPAALLAPAAERRFGAGASAPLFLLAPLLLVLVAGWGAGVSTRLLGGSEGAAATAVVLATAASPLASYASSALSEPLQAACLSLALAGSLASVTAASPRRAALLAAAAGLAAGAAVLAKTVLVAVAPFLLLALLAGAGSRERLRRVGFAAAGAALPLGGWAALELARFGRIAGGYAGEPFSHPLLDGLVRLLFLPDRGLLFFYPAAALAAFAAVRSLRGRGEAAPRLAAAGVGAAVCSLLGLSAAWWCWHGVVGWGPRFVVPSIPLLAPFAALALAPLRKAARLSAVALCLVLNLPPLFANPGSVSGFVYSCPRGVVSERTASAFPPFAVHRDAGGRPAVAASHALPLAPSASPHVVFPWFAAASLAGTPAEAAARLGRPPWRDAYPEIQPPPFLSPADEIPRVAPAPRWGWGRSFLSGLKDPALTPLYLDALSNQVQAALDAGPPGVAVALAEQYRSLLPGGESDALLVEALRSAGRREAAADLVRSLSPAARSYPDTAAAVALWARDTGALDLARRAMQAAAAGAPSGRYPALRDAPPETWPKDLLSARGRSGVRLR